MANENPLFFAVSDTTHVKIQRNQVRGKKNQDKLRTNCNHHYATTYNSKQS
ncbi:MAG: hypothetical protein K0S33_3855 [Bacteroidetes bacterium]|jgi:hypothetical protein|nr:hypothetical protein [Bacteroidota bacterium]